MVNIKLGVIKRNELVEIPLFSTKNSACFDIKSFIQKGDKIKYYDQYNNLHNYEVYDESVIIMPHCRYLIPTGITFNIPDGYSVRIHPRSGLSLKNGIVIANCEGVIDSDYTLETFIMLTNISDCQFIITNGDRISQGELVRSISYEIELESSIEKDSDRKGGFGSTGI